MLKVDEFGKKYTPVEVTASITFTGDTLNPEEITALLQCTSTKSYKIGYPMYPGKQSPIATTNFWALESELPQHVELEEHIDNLFSKTTTDLDIWKRITTEYKTNVFCGVFMQVLNSGFEISPEILKKLGERNLKISFDIYSNIES